MRKRVSTLTFEISLMAYGPSVVLEEEGTGTRDSSVSEESYFKC